MSTVAVYLLGQSDSHDDYWDLLGWDDEDTADPPYVHIFSDGCIAVLHYTTPEGREDAMEFARRVSALKAERDRYREALEWIYAEPEDTMKVQARAKGALDG
jgi:hypothetical protein